MAPSRHRFVFCCVRVENWILNINQLENIDFCVTYFTPFPFIIVRIEYEMEKGKGYKNKLCRLFLFRNVYRLCEI